MNYNFDWDRSVMDSKVIPRSKAKRQKENCRHQHLNYYEKSGVKISLLTDPLDLQIYNTR